MVTSRGLTVLYGLNGAGKTRVLTALREAVAGRYPTADGARTELVLELMPDREGQYRVPDDPRRRDRGEGALGFQTYRDAVRNAAPSGPKALLAEDAPPAEALEQLVAALVDDPVCSVVTGLTPGVPVWELWASGAAGHAAVDRYRERGYELAARYWEIARDHDAIRWTATAPRADVDALAHPAQDVAVSAAGDMWNHVGAEDWRLGEPLEDLWWRDGEGLPPALLPLLESNELTKLFPHLVSFDGSTRPPESAVTAPTATILRRVWMATEETDGWSPADVDTLDRAMEAVSAWVNYYYQRLLADAPPLTLQRLPVNAVLNGHPWAWSSAGGGHVGDLSAAQFRWAVCSMELVAAQTSGHTSPLLVLDEPEAGLHRSAEAFMAKSLTWLADQGVQVVAATHTPALLNEPTATVHEVRPREHALAGVVQPLGSVQLESLARLGLQPSDLLNRYRVVMLVEGHHEKLVFEQLFADELDRVLLIPLRGGKNLEPTAESQFLFDHTGAHVLTVLDNLPPALVDQVWEDARAAAREFGVQAGIDRLLDKETGLPPRRGAEYRFLGEWLAKALTAGVDRRVSAYGLSKEDLVEYLPAEMLIGKLKGRDWAQLRRDFGRATASATRNGPPFKKWLTDNAAGVFDDDSIRAAAVAISNELPEDLDKLRYRLRNLSA